MIIIADFQKSYLAFTYSKILDLLNHYAIRFHIYPLILVR